MSQMIDNPLDVHLAKTGAFDAYGRFADSGQIYGIMDSDGNIIDEDDRLTEENERTLEEMERKKVFRYANQKFPEIQFLFEDECKTGFMPTSNLHLLVGKQGQGKSAIVSGFCAILLGCNSFNIKSRVNNAEVFYIDTEMDNNDHLRIHHSINLLCGYDKEYINPRFHAINVTEQSIVDRIRYTYTYIKKLRLENKRPIFVVIDGIVDYCEDYNNLRESNQIVQWLGAMKSKYNCAILNVMHSPKDEQVKTPNGHLGAILMRKACDGFLVENRADRMEMHHVIIDLKHDIKHRHIPIKPQSYYRDRDRMGVLCQYDGLSVEEEMKMQQEQNVKVEQLQEMKLVNAYDGKIGQILLAHNNQMSTSDLLNALADAFGKSKEMVDKDWKKVKQKLIDNDVISITKKGRFIVVRLLHPELYTN